MFRFSVTSGDVSGDGAYSQGIDRPFAFEPIILRQRGVSKIIASTTTDGAGTFALVAPGESLEPGKSFLIASQSSPDTPLLEFIVSADGSVPALEKGAELPPEKVSESLSRRCYDPC